MTSSTPRIIEPVMAAAMRPERRIILGTSFCGSVISSAAPLESSKPDEHELQQADDGEEPDE